jgi:hypothetical protein
MTKRFFVNGYNPSAHSPQENSTGGFIQTNFSPDAKITRSQRKRSYINAGIELPPLGETVFLRKQNIGRILIYVHGGYRAFIMIVAQSQRKAYLLGNGLKAILTCFQGLPPVENMSGYLLEFTNSPSIDMCDEDIANLINPPFGGDRSINQTMICEIGTGTGIDHVQMRSACEVLDTAIDNNNLLDALMHLDYSLTLVWGDMTGSDYESHYSRDRKEACRYTMERQYLENRFRYDSAFVSAFRGIECILGKPHFRRHEIVNLLLRVDKRYGSNFNSGKYRSWHELFSSRRKYWRFSELIAKYLDLRNAVSAHGNPSPPHIVMEDQVFEIQYLLRLMLVSILDSWKGIET